MTDDESQEFELAAPRMASKFGKAALAKKGKDQKPGVASGIAKAGAVIVACLALFFTSCRCVDRDVYLRLDEGWAKIQPYAVKGIDGDAELTDAHKAIMKRVLGEYSALLREAGAQAGFVSLTPEVQP